MKFKIGDKAYTYENWTGLVYEVEIEDIKENIYEIHFLSVVNRNGIEIEKGIGNSQRTEENLWENAQEVYKYLDDKSAKNVEKLLEQIKTVEDLVKFPLWHCLNGEEYTDYDAIKAYKIKTKELLNIDLNEEVKEATKYL